MTRPLPPRPLPAPIFAVRPHSHQIPSPLKRIRIGRAPHRPLSAHPLPSREAREKTTVAGRRIARGATTATEETPADRAVYLLRRPANVARDFPAPATFSPRSAPRQAPHRTGKRTSGARPVRRLREKPASGGAGAPLYIGPAKFPAPAESHNSLRPARFFSSSGICVCKAGTDARASPAPRAPPRRNCLRRCQNCWRVKN